MGQVMTGIVVTGASGLVGFRLMEQLCRTGPAWGIYHRRRPEVAFGNWVALDLCDRLATQQLLDRLRPTVILHSAALSDPVHCEQHPAEAAALNLGGTMWISQWASRNGAFLVHLSTDLVFDGQQGNYREADDPRPISVYGWTKLASELAVRGSGRPGPSSERHSSTAGARGMIGGRMRNWSSPGRQVGRRRCLWTNTAIRPRLASWRR